MNKNVKHEIQTIPPNSTAQQHFHKSLPPTLFLCSETFSLAWCFVNICCLKQEHASRVAAHVTESLGKGYSDAADTLNITEHTQHLFPFTNLIDHITHAVNLNAKYTQNYMDYIFWITSATVKTGCT